MFYCWKGKEQVHAPATLQQTGYLLSAIHGLDRMKVSNGLALL